jgi:hypothetical protein
MLHAQRDERHLRCAHVANEPMLDGVGLGNPIERGLASTGRGKRRRVGRALQMAEHLLDHLGLGDGGHDPERAALAKGTGAQAAAWRPASLWRSDSWRWFPMARGAQAYPGSAHGPGCVGRPQARAPVEKAV